jgi:hypothetical protein
MTIQPFFSARLGAAVSGLVAVLAAALLLAPRAAKSDPPAKHDYPTVARVEYVNQCIGKSGGALAALYQCSCAIDKLAARLSYDEFVEAGTYAKYAALPGEGGGIFRDSTEAKDRARLYRDLESEARRSCGLVAAP